MNLPLAFVVSSIFIFSSGYYIGHYVQSKSSINVAEAVEVVDKVDQVSVAKKEQSLCINEISNSEKVSSESTTKASSKAITASSELTTVDSNELTPQTLPVTEELSKDNVDTTQLPPPLTETEILQNIESNADLREIEKQLHNSNIELLEFTLADLMENVDGVPSEQIEELRADLNQLKQSALQEVDSNYDSVEITKEEQRAEVIQSLNIGGNLTENSEKMARDMFPDEDVESNLSPTEAIDPPIPTNERS